MTINDVLDIVRELRDQAGSIDPGFDAAFDIALGMVSACDLIEAKIIKHLNEE